MSKQFIKIMIKIFLLSAFFVIIFNLWDNLINAKTTNNENIIKNENNSNFKKISNSSLWKTWVAITTNIWIRFKQRKDAPATIYKEIFSISEIMIDKQVANKELISNNMSLIEEYRNVLKTDIKQLLDSSYDKPKLLNALIEQLEYRYVLWTESMKKLLEQRTIFEWSITSTNTKTESLKAKISNDFKKNDPEETLKNINNYLELKKEYYYASTYIVYVNKFLGEYDSLNKYNKLLLDTLINNKDAIVKNSFVVIPDSWNELLKKFNLIYTEAETKK